NRGEGSISVVSFRTQRVVKTWRIPGGGSPDMGGVSADGKVLWISGRYSGVVYAISTASGRLLARIPVGSGPHGLCVWPQPGRYSLGPPGIPRCPPARKNPPASGVQIAAAGFRARATITEDLDGYRAEAGQGSAELRPPRPEVPRLPGAGAPAD